MSSVEIPVGSVATPGRVVEDEEDDEDDDDDDPFVAVVFVSASLSDTSVDALPTEATWSKASRIRLGLRGQKRTGLG